jgi:AGCS family alanine or glycine:cation symporter
MWVAAFFGMMTNFSENVLGIYYRRKNKDGEWSGGPMYYLTDGLGKRYGKKWLKPIATVLAVLFACFAILASFGIGNMAQINKIVLNMDAAFFSSATLGTIPGTNIDIIHLIIGIALLIIGALIIIGGLKRIARFAEIVVPFMAVAYVIGALVILCFNLDKIGPMFVSIFKYAFKPTAVLGGGIGVLIQKTMTQGFKRGVFSNEAGLGSSVIVHSSSNVKEPVKQGMWGIFEVFFDTFVVCTMTAIVVLSTGFIDLTTGAPMLGINGDTLVSEAFGKYFGAPGTWFVAIAMLFFAFTTVLGWSHYGSKAWEYLFGAKTTVIFKIIHVITVIFGAVMTSTLAWDISDTFNGLMMIPNLIGVVALFPLVMKITKNYINRNIKNINESPVLSYDPEIQAEAEKNPEN